MSVAATERTEQRTQRPAAAEPAAGGVACERCGAPLAVDQEWCLECGAARTRIHRAPDWRIPVAVVAVVVAVALVAFLIALIDLSILANR